MLTFPPSSLLLAPEIVEQGVKKDVLHSRATNVFEMGITLMQRNELSGCLSYVLSAAVCYLLTSWFLIPAISSSVFDRCSTEVQSAIHILHEAGSHVGAGKKLAVITHLRNCSSHLTYPTLQLQQYCVDHAQEFRAALRNASGLHPQVWLLFNHVIGLLKHLRASSYFFYFFLFVGC